MKKFTALLRAGSAVKNPYGGFVVNMSAIYDPNNDEHRKWAVATPAASLNLNVSDEFGEGFEPGEYIVTFEKVEKE